MKGENESTGETYSFKRCKCGAKIHLDIDKCYKCLEEVEFIIHKSTNPEDRIYQTRLNKPTKCMNCYQFINNNRPCRVAICFATARGNCEACRKYEMTRFDCCQSVQKLEGIVTQGMMDTLKSAMAEVSKAQQVYTDEVPF